MNRHFVETLKQFLRYRNRSERDTNTKDPLRLSPKAEGILPEVHGEHHEGSWCLGTPGLLDLLGVLDGFRPGRGRRFRLTIRDLLQGHPPRIRRMDQGSNNGFTFLSAWPLRPQLGLALWAYGDRRTHGLLYRFMLQGASTRFEAQLFFQHGPSGAIPIVCNMHRFVKQRI